MVNKLNGIGSKGGIGSLSVSVEGNIGCGKSTFLNYCKIKPGMAVYLEPIKQWRNVNGLNLLVKTVPKYQPCYLYLITV